MAKRIVLFLFACSVILTLQLARADSPQFPFGLENLRLGMQIGEARSAIASMGPSVDLPKDFVLTNRYVERHFPISWKNCTLDIYLFFSGNDVEPKKLSDVYVFTADDTDLFTRGKKLGSCPEMMRAALISAYGNPTKMDEKPVDKMNWDVRPTGDDSRPVNVSFLFSGTSGRAFFSSPTAPPMTIFEAAPKLASHDWDWAYALAKKLCIEQMPQEAAQVSNWVLDYTGGHWRVSNPGFDKVHLYVEGVLGEKPPERCQRIY